MPSLEFSHKLHHEVKTWDRFIRNRDEVRARFIDVPKEDVQPGGDAIIGKKPYSTSEETYKQLLSSALLLNSRPQSWAPQWPVRSRANPHLHSPTVVLDLPNIRRNIFGHSIMDWSATSYLTVGFPRRVYLWHSPTNRMLSIDAKNTSCLKWNVQGTALFLASRSGTFRFTDVDAEEELTSSNRPPCHVRCFVTCCVFNPLSPVVYMGCCLGSVSAYHVNKGLHIITQVHEDLSEESCIASLGISNDGRHLAIANMGEFVFIYDTMNFAFLFNIAMTGPSRALSWHPWKRNLLVVSDCNGFMALYDILAPTNPQASYVPTLDSSIINLAFNPISAELVVSQRVFFNETERNTENQTTGRYAIQLNVLSSFERVVDRMEGHSGPVEFLNWNPDGTQLATAGMDETARIWDFLPPSKKQRTKKMSCKLNYASASIELGSRMGLTIR